MNSGLKRRAQASERNRWNFPILMIWRFEREEIRRISTTRSIRDDARSRCSTKTNLGTLLGTTNSRHSCCNCHLLSNSSLILLVISVFLLYYFLMYEHYHLFILFYKWRENIYLREKTLWRRAWVPVGRQLIFCLYSAIL
jgi:hypothetical protein